MLGLDMRTVLFSHIIANAVGVLIIFILLVQNRDRYRGIAQWLGGFALQLAGIIMISLRGSVAGWISIILGNTLAVAGMALVISGILRFIGKRGLRLPAVLLLAAYAFSYVYFALIRPSLSSRTYIHSGTLLILFGTAVVLMSRAPSELKRSILRIRLVFAFLGACALARIIGQIARPISSQDFFAAGSIETLVLLGYQAGLILLAFNLILAVNERLIGDIRFQEEKYSKAFQSSPYAILLTDAASGRIFEVNEGFIRITGFDRGEAIGKTTLDLRLWEKEEDRVQMIAALAARGEIHDKEFRFRTRSGQLITGLFSAEIIDIAGRPSLVASIHDITIREKALEDLGRSLEEKELLMKELTHRVKNSLNVVSSLIGFSREAATDPEVRTALADLRTRIGSVSSVYEQLARTGRVDNVDLKAYIQNLADSLARSYRPRDGRVRLKTNLAELSLETRKALPLGLILNEWIINAFKYAYPEGRSGEIWIETKSVTGGICVAVSDDGVGKEAGAAAASRSVEGTGSRLVESLADQIGARVSYPPGPGMTAVIIL